MHVQSSAPLDKQDKYGTDLWAATAMDDERKVDLVSFPPKPPPKKYIGLLISYKQIQDDHTDSFNFD